MPARDPYTGELLRDPYTGEKKTFDIKQVGKKLLEGEERVVVDPVKRIVTGESKGAQLAGDAGMTLLNFLGGPPGMATAAAVGGAMNATGITPALAKLDKYMRDYDPKYGAPHEGPGLLQMPRELARAAKGEIASTITTAAPLLLGAFGKKGAGLENTAEGKINDTFQNILPKDMLTRPKSAYAQTALDALETAKNTVGKQIGEIKKGMPSAQTEIPNLEKDIQSQIQNFVAENLKTKALDPSDASYLLKMADNAKGVKNFDTLDNFLRNQKSQYGQSLFAGANKRIDTSTRLVDNLFHDLNEGKKAIIKDDPNFQQLETLNDKYHDFSDLHLEGLNDKQGIAGNVLNKIMKSDKSAAQYNRPEIGNEIKDLATKDMANASTKGPSNTFNPNGFNDYFDNLTKDKLTTASQKDIYGPDTYGKLEQLRNYIAGNPTAGFKQLFNAFLRKTQPASILLDNPLETIAGMQKAPPGVQLKPGLAAGAAATTELNQ